MAIPPFFPFFFLPSRLLQEAQPKETNCLRRGNQGGLRVSVLKPRNFKFQRAAPPPPLQPVSLPWHPTPTSGFGPHLVLGRYVIITGCLKAHHWA